MANPIQTRFDGGELAERLGGRFDSDLYKKCLAFCENAEPTPQGSLLLRAGSVHSRALTGDRRTRLTQFRMVDGQDYLLEMTDLKMRIYAIDGSQASVLVAGPNDLIVNGDFNAAGGWTLVNANVTVGHVEFPVMSPSPHPLNAYAEQVVTLLAAGNIVLSCDIDLGTIATINVRVGTSSGGNEIFEQGYNQLGGNPRINHLITNINALPIGTYYIRISAAFYGSGTPPNVDNVSFKTTAAAGSTSDIATPWAADEVAAVRIAPDTGLDRAIFTHPNHPPYFLKYSGGTSWDFTQIAFTATPAEWTGAVWPAVCEFAKGRAWFSGLATAKNRVWGSVVGDPFNMTLATGGGGVQLPGDCLDYKIATNGAIQWIKGSTSVLAGTDLGEHSMTGSKGTPLNGDIDVRRESAFGSAAIAAVDAGTTALFVSADRKKIRAIEYDLQTNKWGSKDVTFLTSIIAPSGEDADPVKELHHAWTPEGMIIALQDSGRFAMCSFDPGEKVVAWWRAPLASGIVRSAAVSQGPSGAFLWMAVERAGAMWLERMPLSESTADLVYVDAAVKFTDKLVGDALAMTHLADGTTVRVVCDEALYPDAIVAGGAVPCPVDAQKVVVGLAYTGTGITLPKNIRDGKAQSAKLGVILNKSALPLLNGKRPADRNPATKMDTPEGLRTGKAALGNLGWSDEDKITITMDLPFRTEVLALYSDTDSSR